MNPDRFVAVRELFDRVIELPESEREAALRATTSDPDLAAEVLALCQATDGRATTQFVEPRTAMLQSAAAPALQAGDTLGIWRIAREIGQGGMGSVFLVERVDGHFKQTAALKFVRGMPRPETLAYFMRERQVLATLTHPNIARLIDGGAAPNGQPYLVMEYVEGEAVDQYCASRHLGTDAVLALMLSICAPVAFAHRQLVVHCDLKPNNILVDASGRVTLLDFGIARLVGDMLAGSSQGDQHASPAFTPRYASPEQRAGGQVSTATDVFSLGVMLGDLLAAAGTNAELKAIVAKASATEIDRRYASVEAFADDIQRYRDNKPLSAVDNTVAYVAGKFVRRRWPVIAGVALFAATVGVAATRIVAERDRAQLAEQAAVAERDATRLAQQEAVRERDATRLAQQEALRERDAATRERDRAAAAEKSRALERDRAQGAERSALTERDRAKAAEARALAERNRATQAEVSTRQTNDFLVAVFESGDPDAESGDMPMSKVLTRAEERVEQKLAGQSGTQAELYGMLAHVRNNMGGYDQAKQNYLRAIELERPQNRPLVLAKLLRGYVSLDVATYGGKDGLPLATEALALAEQHAAPDSADVAASLSTMAQVLSSKGQKKEAKALAERAHAIYAKIDPASENTAELLSQLGGLAGDERRYKEAAEYHRKAVALRTKLHGEGSPIVLSQESRLAVVLQNDKQYDESEALMRKVLAAREKLHGRDNARTMTQYIRLANLLSARSRPRESLELTLIAKSIAEKTVGRESTTYVVIQNNISQRLQELGLYDDAIPILRETLPLAQKLWPPDHPALLRLERNVGWAMSGSGLLEEAYPHLLGVYERGRKLNGDAHRDTTRSMIDLASWSVRAGKLDEAAAWLAKIDKQIVATDKELIGARARIGGQLAAAKGDYDTALKDQLRTEQESRAVYGEDDARFWLAKVNRVELLHKRNQGSDRADARVLAGQILAKAAPTLDPAATDIVKLKKLMQP